MSCMAVSAMQESREENMFQYCLFDLDGTLTDPKEGITKSVQHALRAFGIEEPDLSKLEPFIGPPLIDSFMEFYGFDEAEARKAVDVYRERFAPIGVLENNLIPGTQQMLSHAKEKGIHMAVASSKPLCFVRQILEHFDIDQYFEVVIGSELDGSGCAKEEVVEKALARLGVSSMDKEKRHLNCAMIGDRKFDIQGAKAHALTGIGVSFGYAAEGELQEAGAEYIVDNMAELEELLTEMPDEIGDGNSGREESI